MYMPFGSVDSCFNCIRYVYTQAMPYCAKCDLFWSAPFQQSTEVFESQTSSGSLFFAFNGVFTHPQQRGRKLSIIAPLKLDDFNKNYKDAPQKEVVFRLSDSRPFRLYCYRKLKERMASSSLVQGCLPDVGINFPISSAHDS